MDFRRNTHMGMSMEFMAEAMQLSAPATDYRVQQECEPSRLQQRGKVSQSCKTVGPSLVAVAYSRTNQDSGLAARLADAFDTWDIRNVVIPIRSPNNSKRRSQGLVLVNVPQTTGQNRNI